MTPAYPFLQQYPPAQAMPSFEQVGPGAIPKPMPNVPQINPGMPKPMRDIPQINPGMPKPQTDIPQINPGMPPAVSPANPMMPKPQTGAPQINPGPTGNLPQGRGALVNAIMNRTQGQRPQMNTYRPPQGIRPMGQPQSPFNNRPRRP